MEKKKMVMSTWLVWDAQTQGHPLSHNSSAQLFSWPAWPQHRPKAIKYGGIHLPILTGAFPRAHFL